MLPLFLKRDFRGFAVLERKPGNTKQQDYLLDLHVTVWDSSTNYVREHVLSWEMFSTPAHDASPLVI